MQPKTAKEIIAENEELRAQLEEAQQTLNAIRSGQVDGLIVSTPKGEQVYTISGADTPYRVLIESIREGAVMLSEDNTIIYCNSGFAKMIKCPPEKIIGCKIESMTPQPNRAVFKKMLSLGRTSKEAIVKTTTFQAEDGTIIPTQISITTPQTDNATTTFLVVTDLTQHMEEEVKRYTSELELTQVALTESKERWATTLSCVGDAVISTDIFGKITFMNAVAEDVTGWTLNDALQQPVKMVFHIISEQTRLEVENPVEKVLEKGVVVGLANHTILVRKDGVEVPIDDSGAPIKGKDGKIVGVVLVFRDVTERWKAEEAIKRSEVRFRSLFESSFDGVLIAQSDGSIISANPAACRIFGMSEEEIKKVGREGILVMDKRARAAIAERTRTGKVKGEFTCRRGDGSTFECDVSSSIFKEADGSIKTALILRDITERKKVEEAVRESEEKFRQAFAIGPDGFLLSTLKESKLVDVNESFLEMFGYNRQEVIGKSALELGLWVNPSEREKIALELKSKGKIRNLEIICRRKNGETFPILLSTTLMQINNQQMVLSAVRDFSSYNKAKEALGKSEAQLRAYVKATSDAVYHMNADWSEMRQLTGNNFISDTVKPDRLWMEKYIHQDDRQNVKAVIKRAIEAKSVFELEHRVITVDGSLGWTFSRAIPLLDKDGNITEWFGTAKDVTERKKAEEAFRNTERLLSSVTNGSSDAIYVKDRQSRWLFVNPALEAIVGKPSAEVLGKNDSEIYANPKFGKAIIENDQRIMKTGKAETVEEMVDFPDGPHSFISVKAPRFDEQGQVIGIVGISHDITERKKTEIELAEYRKNLEKLIEERTEKLRKSTQQIAEILESTQEGFFALDRNWNYIYVNKRATEPLGMKPEDLIGFNFWKKFPKYEGTELGRALCEVMEKREVRRLEISSAYTGISYEMGIYPSAEGITALSTDITERKKLEKLLHDKERLAAIGATAGMVGHDIRNPLQAITGDIFLAKSDLDLIPESEEKSNIQESLTEIEKNVTYINKIVSDLQDFAKPVSPNLEEIVLENVIQSVLATLTVPENVTVTYSIEKNFPKLKVDSAYLQRIIQNLSNNGIQAMPNGGTLTINAARKENKAVIFVKDTGIGIPESVRSQIFTPLLTTKSKGQGFGLSVVKRFTEGMGGTVSFESAVGNGTKFVIELPIS